MRVLGEWRTLSVRFKGAGVDVSGSVGWAVKGCGADSSGIAHRSTLVIPIQPRNSTVRCFCLYQLIKRVLAFPMHSALAFARSTASDTYVPSRSVVFRRNFPADRLQSSHFAAPLLSYSLAPIREGYELLFPPARPHPFVISYTYNSLGGQPLCFDSHPHCPGVWRSTSRAASVFLGALCVSVANPFFSYDCSLFARSKKVNSFAIKQIQPLFRKCRGVGVGIPNATTGHPGWGYLAVQTTCPATWTRRTHPTIIAARSRSQVYG
jgi:hypothetical protein